MALIREHSGAADRVRAAAVDLFFARGYGRTSVRDITSALDLTPGALYNHFRSKEELLHSIVSRTHADAERITEDAILRAGGDPARQLAEVACALTTYSATFRKEVSISHAEWRNLPPAQAAEMRAARLRLAGLVERLLNRGMRTGLFEPSPGGPAPDTTLLARALLGLVTEVGRWYRPGGHLSLPRIADQYALLALRMAGSVRFPIIAAQCAPA